MYGAQDPGNWQSFLKRQDNAGLPIMEAKSKFLQEQMNFDSLVNFATQAQTNTGGIAQNPLESLIYGGSLNSTVGGFTSTVIVTFTSPVTALYDPQLTVTNGQQGGGSSDAILYEYSTGTGTTALTFTHTQAPVPTPVVLTKGVDAYAPTNPFVVLTVIEDVNAFSARTIESVSDTTTSNSAPVPDPSVV